MAVDNRLAQLQQQRQLTTPEQDIQRLQGVYKDVSKLAPQAQAAAPQTPQSTQQFRFPVPSIAQLAEQFTNLYKTLIQRLGGGQEGQVMGMQTGQPGSTPWGQTGQVTQGFMNPNQRLYADVGGYNRGVDVRAQAGTPLRAPRDLRVADVRRGGWNTGWGNTVQLMDPQTQERFRFSHLSGVGNVRPGDIVRQNMVFGTTGNTGRTTAPHLDLEYQRGNQLADVTKYYPEWFRNG